MRFNNRFTLKSREGEQRIVKKFLFFPRNFGQSVTRWLETANIIEEVQMVEIIGFLNICNTYSWKWIEVGFYD